MVKKTYLPLQKAIEEHKNAHAFLIQGDMGIGRFILAKFLSDTFLGYEEQNKTSEIKDEIIVSMLEDKKSISIDQIRSLKESLLMTSLMGKGKVGIIYPSESMTYPAANGLLKILEEPPKDTLIILITESTGKLPKTIVSRSQIINCGHPSSEDSMKWLKEKENVDWAPIISVFGTASFLNEMGHDHLTNQIDSLSSQITGLIDGEMKPSEISDSWKNEDIELNLRVLYSWIFKYLEIKLLQKNHEQNLPNGLTRMLDKNINHESCFKLMDDIIRLRELKYTGKGVKLESSYH